MSMNATNLRLGILAGAAVMALSGGASADQMARPAAGVTRIVFATPGELRVLPGSDEKVIVEAEGKVLTQLDVGVKGDTLTLASKGSFKTDKGLIYTVTLKAFRSLKTTGSGNSSIEGFGGDAADVELGGSGDVSMKNMKPARLGILIKSSGNVEATGSGKSVSARIDGAGNIDTTGFVAQNVDARVDGSGNIRVHADETLKATIGGAGNIEYKGKAKVTQSVTGAGNVGQL
jgi:hypothetical protein